MQVAEGHEVAGEVAEVEVVEVVAAVVGVVVVEVAVVVVAEVAICLLAWICTTWARQIGPHNSPTHKATTICLVRLVYLPSVPNLN